MASASQVEELLLRWEQLRAQGQTLTATDLCADCPELREELAQRIRALGAMCKLLETAETIPGHSSDIPCSSEWPQVPGYEILGELGRGGMGVVYKARQLGLNRLVALKMVLAGGYASPQALQRFRTEAEAVARLQHPNIVQIHEIGEHDTLPYFSLEYCSGGSLADQLNGTPLPPAQAARIVETLARAMEAAHAAGIIHRDLKPANVLLQNAEGHLPSAQEDISALQSALLKITDFGLAKKQGEAGQTESGAILGTPSYMAPEQAGGKLKEIGPAADIYALGAILYCLLTGRPPFQAATPMDTVLQVLDQEAVSIRQLNGKVPRDLETIAAKCLQKDPAKRYASAFELAEDLARFRKGDPIQARPISRIERAGRWARKHPGAFAAIVTVMAALGFIIVSQAVANWRLETSESNTRAALVQVAQQKTEAERAAKEARELAEQNRRQLVKFNVSGGTQALLDGDFSGALPWYAEALRLDAGDPAAAAIQRARLSAVWRQCPKFNYVWKQKQHVSQVALSPDGRRAATASLDGTVQVWDVETGNAVGPAFSLSGPAYSVAFSPDGKRLVAGGGAVAVNGEVRAWDIDSAKPLLAPIKLKNTVFVVAFLPDGQHVIGIDINIQGDSAARTWELATGHQVAQVALKPREPHLLELQRYLSPASGRVLQVQGTTAQVFDALTGKPLSEPVRHKSDVHFAQLSPDGKRFATVSWYGLPKVHVWDADTGKAVSPPITYYFAVSGINFGPGSHLTTAHWDGTVRSYEIATGQPAFDPRPVVHQGWWRPVFSPDGRLVAVLDQDGSVRIWSVTSKDAVTPALRHSASITHALFSDDGRRLFAACSDGTTRVWDLASAGLPNRTLQSDASSGQPVFTVDGSRFVTPGKGAATLWNAQTLESLFVSRANAEGGVECTELSADGRLLAIGTNTGLALVWETSTAKTVTPPLKQTRPMVHTLAISHDGRYLGSLSADSLIGPAKFLGDAALWDIAAGKPVTHGPLRISSGSTAPGASGLSATLLNSLGVPKSLAATLCIAFSPDSRFFALGGVRVAPSGLIGEAQVYETATGKPAGRVLETDPGLAVFALAFSPDSHHLALMGRDMSDTRGEVRVWDFRAGKLAFPPIPFATLPDRVLFDPAGRFLLATYADKVLLCRADSGKAAYPPLKHSDRVILAEFSRDGKVLITASNDNRVSFWDVATGEPLTPPLKQPASIRGAALQPNGQRLVVACSDNALRVWDLTSPDRADDLERMARLLSCRRVEGASTTAVADDILAADWKVLRAKYPADFIPSKDRLLDWHAREADACQNQSLWEPAVRHMDRLIELAPERGWYRSPRGWFHAQLGHYQQAADDYAWAMQAQLDEHWNWYCAGCARLALDDRAGYRKLCEDRLRRFRDAKEPVICERVAKTCLIIPGAAADPALAIELASRATTVDPKTDLYPWCTFAKGIAEYRAGRFDQAIVWLDKTCGIKERKDPMCDTLAQLFLAMAHQQVQQPEKARALLEAAQKSVEEAVTNPGTTDWINRVHGKAVLQEARGLIK